MSRGKITAHAVWCSRCEEVWGTWRDGPRKMVVPRGK
jgi:hypothetical protein